ncbi:MAG TPA: ABC transporter transmembrane domain-containing protein, partial [Terriglobales bacterium]|nr:ABC transporter transmembrane domain-containing protein [Terriglobales bacterium]
MNSTSQPGPHPHRLLRLLHYVRPYSLAVLGSVILLAATGLLDAFRVVLIKPIFDGVLKPEMMSRELLLFRIPRYGPVYLHQFLPNYFHNAWTMVAVALVGATFLKGICDYVGTYLVSYAGFGMITDLRNELFQSILRRSLGFFQRH